jgi:hypothetical protein
MGGPIVRTGTTPEFWKNWEKAFGKGKGAGKKSGGTVTAKKKSAKPAKSAAKKKKK